MTDRSTLEEGADWPAQGPRALQDEAPTRRLTRDEAQALTHGQPLVSPWRVVAVQGLLGLLCSACLGWWFGPSVGWSAAYGAAAVVLPNALLARGMTRRAGTPVASALGFLVWEMLKLGVAIAMLLIAARVVPQLSWPALLAAMVVCMKVNWFALLWRGRR